ncbi:MAG: TRAP transporter substrate-binding protein [Desulfocucumaceae bacterium]
MMRNSQKRRGIARTLGILALVLVVAIAAAGCGKGGEKAAADKQYVFKVGHAMTDTHPFQAGLVKFAELAAQKSDNKIKVEVFASGVLGGTRDRTEGVKNGIADMELVGSTQLGAFVPQMLVADLPFIFKDVNHVDKVFQGEVGKRLAADSEKQGIKVLGWGENGFRHVFNRARAINTVEDMKGLKLRVFPNQVYVDTFKALGSMPVTTDWGELFTALSQKTVDGAEAAPAHFITGKFGEAGQKYFSLTGHMYVPAVLIMNNSKFNEMPKDLQKALSDAAIEAMAYQRKVSREEETKFLADIKAQGIQLNDIPDKSKFVELTKGVYGTYESKIGKDLIEAVKNAK